MFTQKSDQIAVEIGFGDVKVIGEGIKFKFPAVIAYGGSGVLSEWDGSEFSNHKGYCIPNS